MYKDGNSNDPNSFSISLASKSGFQYQLRIQNMEEFAGFALSYQNIAFLEKTMELFKIIPDKTDHDFSAQNELKFLQFLQATKSGLKFF